MDNFALFDLSGTKGLGKGKILPPGSFKNPGILSKVRDYKTRVAGTYKTVQPDKVERHIPPGCHYCSR